MNSQGDTNRNEPIKNPAVMENLAEPGCGLVEWREVVRDMHVRQAQTWRESAVHWRACAKKALQQDKTDVAARAHMIALLAEGYAEEEQRLADDLKTKMAEMVLAESGAVALADAAEKACAA